MRFLAPLLAAFLVALPALAQPLTDEGIARWADSYSDLMSWAETNDVDPGVAPGDGMFRRAMTALQPTLDYADVSALLAGHGYGDPMGWAELSDRIVSAYMSLEMAGTQAQIAAAQPQIMAQLQALLENPSLTDTERQEIMASMAQLETFNAGVPAAPANPEDMAAVERNRAVIHAAMDSFSN